MSSTIKLSDTQAFCAPMTNWLNLAAGVNSEPLITSANLALQTITSPPFAWPWNRSTVEFNIEQGTQDYAINISDFGYLETASVQMMAEITSVSVSDGIAVFTAANNFASLLANGSAPTRISGCTTSALNGAQKIVAATPTSFSCNINTPDLVEDETGAEAVAGPIMSLEIKVSPPLTDAIEQDRPTFICDFTSSEVALSITKSHTGNFTQGQTGATYQLVVTNTGSASTSGTVTVTEIPSSGLTFVSMSGTGWTVSGLTATRSDALSPGSSYPAITVAVNVASEASSPQVNQATVAGGGLPISGAGSAVTASDSTTIEPSGITPYFNSTQNDSSPVNFGFISPLNVVAGQYSSIQNTAPGDIKVGDTGVLFFVTYGGSGVSITSVQDSLGNNWTPRIAGLTVIGSNQFWMYSAPMQTAVAIGDSFTITISIGGTYSAIERAFVNVGGITGLDQVADATYALDSVPALVAGPVNPSQPAVLLSAMIADVDVSGFGAVSEPTGYIPAIRHSVDGRQLLPVFFTDYPSATPTVPPGSYSVSWPVTPPATTTGGAVALVSFIVA